MNEHRAVAAAENPFSTRRVRPGALPFLFGTDGDAAHLADRLRNNGWWGQIVGPHGSGKSALLATLVPAIERAGRQAVIIELHDRAGRLPSHWKRAIGGNDAFVLAVDGYEHLTRWRRFQLKRFCRRAAVGLLVTSHTPVGLPGLFHTAASLELARRIVEQLQRDHPPHVAAEDVAEPFSRHGGNLRETLFDLYDLYERRRRGT